MNSLQETNINMKTDSELQQDVMNAIKWEPFMHAAEIGVTAKDGIVTLSGSVDSYSKKDNAENAAKNVIGVKAIAADIVVDYGNNFKKNDTHIAEDVLNSWKYNWKVPSEKIKVKVEDGWVKMEGTVMWKYQEDVAKEIAENIDGVLGVNSFIKVRSESMSSVEKKDIEHALERNWAINGKDITVEVAHDNVILSGIVHSLYQKDEAGRLAWNANGVNNVQNELIIA